MSDPGRSRSKIFQFQYGAIKGRTSRDFWCNPNLFQFQYGAIKGGIIRQINGKDQVFQFQYGAIKGIKNSGAKE